MVFPFPSVGGLPETPGRFQGVRGSKGSKVGARGVSWGLPEAPGRFQGPRDAHGARGAREASWGLSEAPGSEGE